MGSDAELAVSVTEENDTLQVCPAGEVVTLFEGRCEFCGTTFQPTNRRQRFCKSKCRVDAHREPQRARRRRWTAARFRDKLLEFDGRYVGPTRNVGLLADFERRQFLQELREYAFRSDFYA